MRITSSYGVEIRKQNSALAGTVRIYREAVRYLILFYDSVWEGLIPITEKHRRFNYAEHLIHSTKKNRAVCDFDQQFPKMPSYLRRSAITHALGAVSSFRSRVALWEQNGRNGRKPSLGEKTFCMPVFYRDNMYRESEGDCAELKVYEGNDWIWKKVSLLHTDMEYLRKNWTGKKASAPVLERRHKKYFLRFSYEEEVSLTETPVTKQRICAVDLGMNTDAVCSIMGTDGTVFARKFIDFPNEKDHLSHVLGRIRRFQREHGSRDVRSFWKYAVRLNDELAKKIAAAIVSFAAEQQADVIVFEYLNIRGRIRGSKRMRLHLWKKNSIQEMCIHKGHRLGIRISRVCAWNTSRLAYDGSGPVERNQRNHSLCVFSNGKQYNCDLSASYNIGARYFIRELLKPLPATERSVLEAEVPAVQRRTSCVHADLCRLCAVMHAEEKAA